MENLGGLTTCIMALLKMVNLLRIELMRSVGNNMCKKCGSAAPLRESKALLLVLLKNIPSFKSLFVVFTTCVDADLKDLVE